MTLTDTIFRGYYSDIILEDAGGELNGKCNGGGVASLTDCTIAGNTYADGIYSADGQPTLVNSSITGNLEGVSAFDGGATTITGTTISGNRGFGGLL